MEARTSSYTASTGTSRAIKDEAAGCYAIPPHRRLDFRPPHELPLYARRHRTTLGLGGWWTLSPCSAESKRTSMCRPVRTGPPNDCVQTESRRGTPVATHALERY